MRQFFTILELNSKDRRGTLNRLKGDGRGGVVLMTAMAMTSLLGVAGFAVEVGGSYLLRRNMQAAVDAAAMAGAANFEKSKDKTAAEAAAQGVASRNGFIQGVSGTTVAQSADPGTGRVTVTVQRNATSILLGSAFGTKVVRAHAVAQMVDTGAKPCVTALSGSISVGNNTDISAGGCALVSNSAASNAFCLGSNCNGNGSGHVTAAAIVTHGGCEGCVGATDSGKITLTRSDTPNSYASQTPNSYSDLNSWPPQPPPCGNTSSSALSPGCYNSISNQPSGNITLTPGVYYIRGGDLDIKGGLTCPTCTPDRGVSIVLFGNNNGSPGKVEFGSQARVTLNASVQTTTALNGVLFYRHDPNGQVRGRGNNGKCDFDAGAGATLRLDGAIVAPNSCASMGGNSATDPNSCNVFVVASMEFSGNSSLSAEGCRFYGTETPTPRIVRLVE